MIVLGEKKGTKDEPHYVLTVNTTIGETPFGKFKVDVYAQTAEEAWTILKEYLTRRNNFSEHGFKVNETHR